MSNIDVHDYSYHVVNQTTRNDHPQYVLAAGLPTSVVTSVAAGAGIAVTGGDGLGHGALTISQAANPIGGLVGNTTGPSSQTDYSTATPVFTLAVPFVNGRSYEICLKAEGQQITNPSSPTQVYVSDSLGLIPTTFLKGVMANLAAGAYLAGGASQVITATSTATDTFTVTASSAAAYRVSANAIALSVKRVA